MSESPRTVRVAAWGVLVDGKFYNGCGVHRDREDAEQEAREWRMHGNEARPIRITITHRAAIRSTKKGRTK